MSNAHRRNPARTGVTLVKLLVVIGILLVLATIAVPAMRPLTEARRIREPARSINVFFGQARNRAIERRRRCGVLLERLPQQPQACVVLRQVEVPPPYAGDLAETHIRLVRVNGADGRDGWYVRFTFGETCPEEDPAPHPPPPPPPPSTDVSTHESWKYLVNSGDEIQFNFQGHVYRVGFPGADKYVAFLENDDLPYGPTDSGIIAALYQGLPFQVTRQPVVSADAPLQLSRGAVVDLGSSGTEANETGFAPADIDAAAGYQPDLSPVVVLFGPGGAVDRLIVNHQQNRVTGPIYLLVGKWERMLTEPLAFGGTPQSEDGLGNWQDATNLWLALNSQTGLVTVAELHADFLDPTTNTYVPSGADRAEQIATSRKYARQAQISMGGG
jgi:type II secretory pathway pseudopilin PulG